MKLLNDLAEFFQWLTDKLTFTRPIIAIVYTLTQLIWLYEPVDTFADSNLASLASIPITFIAGWLIACCLIIATSTLTITFRAMQLTLLKSTL